MKKPVLALVGRPNVGKSTLFNRLAGERLAIVDDVPGTTRDRLLADSEWNGRPFHIIDTGGIDPVGGDEPLSIGSADYINDIKTQAQIAIQEADVVCLVTDGNVGVTTADLEIAQILRKNQTRKDNLPFPPILLVVNKADNKKVRDEAYQFYELGLGDPYPISALHGTGTGDLLDDVVKNMPQLEEEEDDNSIKIAIVGKPNVGKSSLLNRLMGEQRALVSPIAGTTRDAVDTYLEYDGLPITLIDTAGIRRRGKIIPGVERYSVIRALRAIERCDVALLMIDATSGITAQDTHIAGFILEEMKSTVVLVNKWDAIEKDTYTMNAYSEKILQDLKFMDYVPILFISALTGQRINQVLPLALKVQEERLARIPTSSLNSIIQDAQDAHTPSYKDGRQFRIYYGTQVRSDPPTFLLYVNDPKLVHFSYRRFIENRIRREFQFIGTPIKIVFKKREH